MFSIKIIEGDDSTKDKVLELTYTGNSLISVMNNTIEVVSGPDVTHNGYKSGGLLHYKKDTDKDYSSLQVLLSQKDKGTSVVKVVCVFTDESEKDLETDWHERHREHLKNDPNRGAVRAWEERQQVALGFGEEFTEKSPELAWPPLSKEGLPIEKTFTTEEISITYK